MKKLLIIVGDFNDGDFGTTTNEVQDKEINKLLKIATAISKCQVGHNWEGNLKKTYPTLTQKEFDWFNHYLPFNGETGESIHSIVTIKILTVTEEQELYSKYKL
jgi:hypothetical protein